MTLNARFNLSAQTAHVAPSHGLLADDTSSASLYSCTTDAVFSEVHDQ